MAANTVIVDIVDALAPAAQDKPGPGAAREGMEIRFGQGTAARLGSGAPALLSLLQSLQRSGRPVYVELGAGREIVRLLLPLVAKVEALETTPNGDVGIRLAPSAAVHTLRHGHPDFAAALAVLRAAQASGQWLAVSENDAHEVVDVRPFVKGPERRGGEARSVPRAAPKAASPTTDVHAMFDLVTGFSCDPRTAPAPCNPFLYPDDGCWARAHEMCGQMVAAGALPKKIWASGGLKVASRNTPLCKLGWYYHVAPLLEAGGQAYVIDPSMFGEAVSQSVWLAAMNNPKAAVNITPWQQYNLGGGEDPDFTQTQEDLDRYREQLRLRSLGPDGPPPYAFCP